MNYKILCTCIWWFTVTITCSPLLQNRGIRENDEVTINQNQDVLKFMQTFGYLVQDGPQALTAKDELVTALKLVQKFGGLEQTGIIDNNTLKLVKSKRCGVPDISLKQKNTKNKRFVIPSDGWNKRVITYFISNFTPKLSRDGITNEIQRAFTKWSRYSRITFSEVYNTNADILISFGVSNHGDQFPFDGPGNVLAHAFYPTELGYLGGDIHFDDSEDWTLDNSYNGVDFYSVAIHEMGHSLGLGHSSEPNSIMNPYYTGPQPQDIGYDDILGMHSLYISRTLPDDQVHFLPSTIQPQPSPKVPKKPHVHWSSFSHETCTDDNIVTLESVTTYKPEVSTRKNNNIDECKGNFDAISCFRGEIFVFKDSNYKWSGKFSPYFYTGQFYACHPALPVVISVLIQTLAETSTKLYSIIQKGSINKMAKKDKLLNNKTLLLDISLYNNYKNNKTPYELIIYLSELSQFYKPKKL